MESFEIEITNFSFPDSIRAFMPFKITLAPSMKTDAKSNRGGIRRSPRSMAMNNVETEKFRITTAKKNNSTSFGFFILIPEEICQQDI